MMDFKNLMRIIGEESERFFPSRREFLKKSTLGTAATLALSSCASFDRWVVGNSNQLEQEVMIIGAGLAGLSAAYHLKKNKIPYRVYEASSRIGGRVQTVFHVNADNQFVELGGEFFESSHRSIMELCRELSVTVQDISFDLKSDRSVYWINGKAMSEKEFRKKLRPLVIKLIQVRRDAFSSMNSEVNPQHILVNPQAKKLDIQSLADFLDPLRGGMDEGVLQGFENLCVCEWGVDSKEINFLHFLVKMDLEERINHSTPSKVHRVEGGMGQITRILGERVQGIVPNSNLRLEHELIAIRNKSDGYECTFRTSKGSETVWARQMICTLPLSILKEVDGIQTLDLGIKKDVITGATYATHSKVVSSFKEPFWRKKQANVPAFQGSFRGQLHGQCYWDSSRGQSGARGLLTSQRGGSVGQATGANASQESLQDIKKFFKDAPTEESFHVSNWAHKPFAKGSRLNLKPGTYLKFIESLIEDKQPEGFFLAGEHWSFAGFGTMNGAVATGIAAAEKALRKAFAKEA